MAILYFGAGLISSLAEMEQVLSGRIRIKPFTIENGQRHDKAVWDFNDTLFVFESLAELKHELRRYFEPLWARMSVEEGRRRSA